MTKLTTVPYGVGVEWNGLPGRNIITWRTPSFGYVQMYIGPQNISISDKKIFTSTRTKAGFIYQYAGEDLTQIAISGTTGSSGIEGINILESVYRSEQEGFKGIAEGLDRAVALKQFNGAISNLVSGAANSLSAQLGANIGELASAATNALDVFNQPTPTLATLATAVELSYQGVTFRGFFSDFSVTEDAGSPGLFDYRINFTAYSKTGVRQNFMPWHRRADMPANSSDLNLLTFGNTTVPEKTLQDSAPTADGTPTAEADAQTFAPPPSPFLVGTGHDPFRGRDIVKNTGINLFDDEE